MKRLRLFVALTVGLMYAQAMNATALWVGESFTCDATSAVMGLTSDVSWTSNGGYFSMSGSGLYRKVTVTQYFSGSATIKCSWKYRLYSGDKWRTNSKSWTFTCNSNPASISPTSMTLSPGSSKYVSYSHKYSNSYTGAANAYFSSSDPSIATVSSDGQVTGVAPGTTYITLYSKISAEKPYCTVTVKEVKPTGVTLKSEISVTEGESTTLTPTVKPSGAETSFTWKSDDESIATVSSSGRVTGVKAGKTKVTVTTTVGGYSASCSVTVKEPPVAPTEVTLKKAVSLYKGFAYTLSPELKPDNAETQYTWKSSDTSVATVSSSGKVTAKGVGATTITVTTDNGLKASCDVTVSALPDDMDETTLDKRISAIQKLINKTFEKTSGNE